MAWATAWWRLSYHEGIAGSGTGERLAEVLRAGDVERVNVVGVATDHCVRATTLDAARLGFEVRVAPDLSAGVAPEATRAAVAEMTDMGIEAVTSDGRSASA